MQLTRRIFLKDLGKLTIAAAVVSACSTESDGVTNGVTGTIASTTVGNSVASTAATTVPAETTIASTSTMWGRAELGFVSAYVLVRGGEAMIVDTGGPGSAPAIATALGALGVDWDAVGHVVATHLHGDHVGSFADVMEAAASATGYAGTADLGSVPSPRQLVGLDGGERIFAATIVATPGHTPGHISVVDEAAGILVAGDALNGTDGSGLTGANPQFTPDMATAATSIAALAEFEFAVALVGHGEPVVSGAADLVRQLASG